MSQLLSCKSHIFLQGTCLSAGGTTSRCSRAPTSSPSLPAWSTPHHARSRTCLNLDLITVSPFSLEGGLLCVAEEILIITLANFLPWTLASLGLQGKVPGLSSTPWGPFLKDSLDYNFKCAWSQGGKILSHGLDSTSISQLFGSPWRGAEYGRSFCGGFTLRYLG